MRIFLLWLATLVAGLASASIFQAETDKGALTVQRIYRPSEETLLEGRFILISSGEGIVFRCTATSVELNTTAGEVLVRASRYPSASAAARALGHKDQSTLQDEEKREENNTEGDEEVVVFYQLQEDAFVEYYGHVQHRGKEDRGWLLSSAQTVGTSSLDQFEASVDGLLDHPAVQLLESVSYALGNDLGLTGRSEPASMPFHMLSLALTTNRKRRIRSRDPVWSALDQMYGSLLAKSQGKFPNCNLDSCPPCPEDNCYGMCGYECTCWRHICQDCCYHRGCRDHETCCRREGQGSPSCIFPLWFSCDTKYRCRRNQNSWQG